MLDHINESSLPQQVWRKRDSMLMRISRLEVPDRFTGIRIYFSLTVPSVSAPQVRTNTALRRSHIQYRLHTLSLSLSLSHTHTHPHPLSLSLSLSLSPPAFSAAWVRVLLVVSGDIAQLLWIAAIAVTSSYTNAEEPQRLSIWRRVSICFNHPRQNVTLGYTWYLNIEEFFNYLLYW